jgi:hypothetical protein
VALPATSAQASTESFSVSVTGGYNNSQALGTAGGTLTATAGGTTLQYSFQLCGQSTYPNSRVTITAGSGSTTQYVSAGSCQSFSGTVTSSYAFSTASVTLTGATFYPGNTWSEYSKTRNVSFVGTPPPPPPPGPAVTNSFSASVTGGYNNSQPLGTVSGTLTATTGGATSVQYSFQLCGQSTYPNSRVTITAGSASTTQYASSGTCQSFSGTLASSSTFTTVSVVLYGSTFYPGNTYTTYSKTRTVYF